MKINADFSLRAVVHADGIPWIDSPIPGVQRRMLDRVGDEIARATSIVRYAPGSKFSAHTHDGGEEFLVLEGVFQDEHGDYPVGTYVRNPPSTHHVPRSQNGCVIFVKLWQFDPNDRTPVVIDTSRVTLFPNIDRHGIAGATLFEDSRESVRLEVWDPGTQVMWPASGGLEVLVLAGSFRESKEQFTKYSWLRIPAGDHLTANAGPEGARVWLKTYVR